MRYVYVILLSISVLVLPSQAQTGEASWENVRRLQTGHNVQVVEQNLRSRDGVYVSATEEALTFRVAQSDVVIQQRDVLRVSSREHLSRGKKALIGLGIGAAAGAAVGAIAFAKDSEDTFLGPIADREAYIGAGMVLFGGVGAGVGALLPSGHPTIYRAEPRQAQGAP